MNNHSDRVILFGLGNEFRRWNSVIKYLEEHVEVFCISEKYDKENIYGYKVVRPYQLNDDWFMDFRIVIMANSANFIICKKMLCDRYNVNGERIISPEYWIGTLLYNDYVKIRPSEVRLDISTMCQLNCVGCYMRNGTDKYIGSGYITADVFRAFLLHNKFIKRVELSNSGEVFLNPEIPEIFEIANNLGVAITIQGGTNFNDVSDEALDAMVKYNVKEINIAIDGATQKVYEKYRRCGDFGKVIRNIEKLNILKEKYNSKKPIINWQYILMKHNEDDIYKAVNKAKELGMNIQFKLDWGDGFKPKEMEKVKAVTGLNYFSRKEFLANEGRLPYDHCIQMIFMPVINWDGRLLGCCSNSKYDWGCNCFEKQYSLEDVVNNRVYKKTIGAMLMGIQVESSVKCYNCANYHRY